MTLQGYTAINEAAVLGGAPIDTQQAQAFRNNDVLFEKLVQSLMCSPFMPTTAVAGTSTGDVVVNSNDFAKQFINARNIHVTTACELTARVPLIWIARERILIQAEINAVGKGAQTGQKGDFGGSGGGGSTAGFDCMFPFSTTEIMVTGGTAGSTGENLETAFPWMLSRAMLYLPFLTGGAAGADDGGAGGGVVCLCAPIIEFRGVGKINAVGAAATANNKGGGGGGFIYMVGRQLINVVDGASVRVAGGAAEGGTGRAGGNGLCVRHQFE